MTPDTTPLRPLRFSLPEEWPRLEAAIAPSEPSTALSSVLEVAREHEPTDALLEVDYIDADYRNEYASFYAQTFKSLPDRCRRLHFFRRERASRREAYLGFVVLRPIPSRPVGRTVIAPPQALAPFVSCRTHATSHPYGHTLAVPGFPFMEQDAQLGVCAHASVWMVSLYHHLAHRTPRRYISDVELAANARLDTWRPAPSDGLTDEQVGAALRRLELNPLTYAVDDPPENENVEEVICCYLNSRLPVVLTTPGHVTVLIGYGRDQDGKLFFIRSDEGTGPYVRVYADDDPLGAWDLLLVPRPGRIYLPGESAEFAASSIFASWLREPAHHAAETRLRGRLRLRSYVVPASTYKHKLAGRDVPRLAAASHRRVPTSRWVWVVELQDPVLAAVGRRCVVGELAFDATSDRLAPNPLFGHLPGRAYAWLDRHDGPLGIPLEDYAPYLSGTALHDAPTEVQGTRPRWSVGRWRARRRKARQASRRRSRRRRLRGAPGRRAAVKD